MMHRVILTVAVLAVGANSAAAQSTWIYAAAVGGADHGGPDVVQIGTTSTVGGLVGFRVSEAWSLEVELDAGSGRSSERVYDGLLSSRPPGPGPHTAEDYQHYAEFARVVTRDTAGGGYSGQLVWRSRLPGRVNVAVLGGVAGRTFTTHTSITMTSHGPGVIFPTTDRQQLDKITSREIMGGVMAPIRVANRVSVAPELRYRYYAGLLNDKGAHRVVQLRARVMWGF
jgi:hypothetical protein